MARAISVLRNEPAWEALEEVGAFLILGSQYPFLIIGATRKWSQVQLCIVYIIVLLYIIVLCRLFPYLLCCGYINEYSSLRSALYR